MNAWYRILKKDILSKLDDIDKHCEIFGLIAEMRQEQKIFESSARLDYAAGRAKLQTES